MKPTLFHPTSTLILALALCFFTGCSGNSEKAAAKVAENKTTTTANTSEKPSDVAVTEPNTNTTVPDSAVAQVDTPETTPASPRTTEEMAPLETNPPKPVVSENASGNGRLGERAVDEQRLADVLDLIAQDLEAQNLAYDRTIGQDCSGIYHKIKDQLQRKFSALGDKSKYTYPSFHPDRNTRQIANWYYLHNNLYIVKDAMADRNKIRPGSVMFFGRTDEKFNNPDIATLTNADVFQHDKAAGKGKIYHVGVVTKVEKDDAGNVVRYTLMHGRNTRHPASRTSGNYDGPGGYGRAFQKFPFGNWNQQWVAVANIETPVQ